MRTRPRALPTCATRYQAAEDRRREVQEVVCVFVFDLVPQGVVETGNTRASVTRTRKWSRKVAPSSVTPSLRMSRLNLRTHGRAHGVSGWSPHKETLS